MTIDPTPPARRPDAETAGNIPEFTVAEISGAVKRTLETGFARVRVRGEITELKRYPSGHLYLSLKDETAKIAAVVWRNAVARLGLAPENGVEVVATGRITAYAERSSYQLVIERLAYAGEGALLARIEALRLRLAQEGLFDADRKRPLPVLPRVVGVVTSASGAVLHDIATTISRRCPRDLLLWPVPVQGDDAAPRIAAAIRGFDAIAPGGAVPRPDVLIVARGGGALEDLMAFSDEAVLRAVAACRIPVISAVGHETDTTLIDFVSDRRAPTPTAAAEFAVPLRSAILADLAHRAARLAAGLSRVADGARLRLDRAGRRLPDLPALLEGNRMRLDDRHHRLRLALPHLLAGRRAALAATGRMRLALPAMLGARGRALAGASRHLPGPHALIGRRQASLGRLGAALDAAGGRPWVDRRHALARLPAPRTLATARLRVDAARLLAWGARLEAVSYANVLARGFALVQRPDETPVTRAAGIAGEDRLVLRFADGTVGVRAERRPRPTRQGSLPL